MSRVHHATNRNPDASGARVDVARRQGSVGRDLGAPPPPGEGGSCARSAVFVLVVSRGVWHELS